MRPPPTLSVIVLNWNGRLYLEDCLSALAAQTYPIEQVILADNASTDGSVAFVRGRFPWVIVRENGGNIGFAAGNNAALREVTADIAVLLNPDVSLSPDALAVLAGAMAADPRLGVAGGKLWYPGGEVIQYAGGFITQPQAMPGHYGVGERDEGQHDEPRDVEYVIGGLLAISRALMEAVGLMDEGFYLYFEDADLCARATRAGFRVGYLPEASAIHVESATTVKGSFAYLQRFHSGRWRYLLKHFPAETITGQTLAAEAAWLGRVDANERRAAALAYLATERGLDLIWQARERDGGGIIPDEARRRVRAGLIALRDQARAAEFDSGAFDRLSAAAELRERPFASTFPLLGPLIARFRTAWNNVASRWYVNHLMAQQNAFNRLAVDQLARYEAELREQMELLELQVISTAELQEQIERLGAQLQAAIAESQGAVGEIAGPPRANQP